MLRVSGREAQSSPLSQAKPIGGTGRFAGVAGGGPFTLRSSLRDIKLATAASAQETAHGIIFWPALRYTLP